MPITSCKMNSTASRSNNSNFTAGSDGGIEINIHFAILIPVLVLVTTILNMGTIMTFWKFPSLREKPSDLLILNLSCADLIMGMVLLPITAPVYITPNYWPSGEIGCVVVIIFLNICIHGSLFALTLISIERFLLVYMEYPQYIKTVTRRRIHLIIAAGWTFAFCTVVIETGLWDIAKVIDESAATIPFDNVCLSPARRIGAYSLTIFLGLYLFPVLLVCGLSLGFLYQLRKRLDKNKPGKDNFTPVGQINTVSNSHPILPPLNMKGPSATLSKEQSKDCSANKVSMDVLAISALPQNQSIQLSSDIPKMPLPSLAGNAVSSSFLSKEQTTDCSTIQMPKNVLDVTVALPSSEQSQDSRSNNLSQIILKVPSQHLLDSIETKTSLAPDRESGTLRNKKSGKRRTTVTNRDRQLRNRYIKPGITLGALVTAMAICMLPYCFYVIVTESGCEQCNDTVVLYWLLLLQFCNATIDPLIYVLTRKKMRQFYYNACTRNIY